MSLPSGALLLCTHAKKIHNMLQSKTLSLPKYDISALEVNKDVLAKHQGLFRAVSAIVTQLRTEKIALAKYLHAIDRTTALTATAIKNR